jgi:uncharacterized membrane protein
MARFKLPVSFIRSLILPLVVSVVVVIALMIAAPDLRVYVLNAKFHPHAPDVTRLMQSPSVVKLHLAAALTAFFIGVFLLSGKKGATSHRIFGWVWVIMIIIAAASSLFIRTLNHGQFSFIHILSVWTLITAPLVIYFARKHDVARHSRTAIGLFIGGLVVAGLFAFVPGRLMWDLFFG